MAQYLNVAPCAIPGLNSDSQDLLVWFPKLEAATAFESEADASSWTQAGDATGVSRIDGKWYVVKD